MAPDDENRKAKAKKRAKALGQLSVNQVNGTAKVKHPQAGLRADIKRMAQRSKKRQKIPFSNQKLRDIVLWKPLRKENKQRPRCWDRRLSMMMCVRDNGGEQEVNDSKMDTLVGIRKWQRPYKVKPAEETQPDLEDSHPDLEDSQDASEDAVQSAFEHLDKALSISDGE
jgi:hypothetical protein